MTEYRMTLKTDVQLPPSTELKFVKFDFDENAKLKTLPWKCLHYEIHKNEKLVCHKGLHSQSVLLVKSIAPSVENIDANDEYCNDSKDDVTISRAPNKSTHWITHITVSGDSLKSKRSIKKRLKIGLASFCESQQLLALYSKHDNKIYFYSCKDKFVQLREKRELTIDFEDYTWSSFENKNCEFVVKCMLFEESKNYLLIIDNTNDLRIYDLNTQNWLQSGEELQLGDDFEHFLVTPDGCYLLAFKPSKEIVFPLPNSSYKQENSSDTIDSSIDANTNQKKRHSSALSQSTTDDFLIVEAVAGAETETNDDNDAAPAASCVIDEKFVLTDEIEVSIFVLHSKKLLKTRVLPSCFQAKHIQSLQLKKLDYGNKVDNVNNNVSLIGMAENKEFSNKISIICCQLNISVSTSHLQSNLQQMQRRDDFRRRIETKVCRFVFFL